MSTKRIVIWVIAVPVIMIMLWVIVLFWFNEVRFHLRKPSAELSAALSAQPVEYICPEPPNYHRVEEKVQAQSSDRATYDDIIAVWSVDMVEFEICNRQYLTSALVLEANINEAYTQQIAISQRDRLIKKQRKLEKHLVPAKRMANRAKEAKTMWIDGVWPEAFLEELKINDPASYQLLTGNVP